MCNKQLAINNISSIFLGHEGENNARTIKIDMSEWVEQYPSALFSIVVLRPTETDPYIANTTTVNGVLEWEIINSDTAKAGMGKAEIRATDGDTIVKSEIVVTRIAPCLEGTVSPAPPPAAQAWVDAVIEKADEILDAQAEQFNINEQGHLIVTKIDGTTEDLGQVVGSGGVTSVNNKTGEVVLDAIDVSAVPQVTGEFLYNGGYKIENPKWHNKIVQCTSNYSDYVKGYFYYIDSDGDLREQIDTQPQPVIPQIEHIQKTGTELNDIQDLEVGNIYQCTSDRSVDHATISNDTQFHQGYFYLYNGEQAQYTYTRKDTQPTSGGAVDSVNGKTGAVVLTASDVGALPDNTPIPTKTSDLQNDSGFISDNDTLPVGSVEVDVNFIKAYDYEQTYTIPNDITSGSTVYVEFAYPLREFVLEITTPEKVISAGTGYFYLSLENNVGGGRFWEPALGQSHASKLCVSFTVGRDGIYRLNGYKYDLTNNSDYSLMTSYNTLARQNIGRLFLENPRPIASIYFTSGGDISELAGSTIKVRGLKW